MDNRRKKPVITGTAQFTSGTTTDHKAAARQRVSALYSPVNPFEADRHKDTKSSTPVSSEKRKGHPSKTASTGSLSTPTSCKRLSSDFHRRCCADENDHDHKSCTSLSDRKQREAESPSPSGDRAISRRSQSVPRAALRPITTTLSTIKRMEYNLERARDAAINSPMPMKSPHTVSTRRTPVTGSGSRSPATPAVFSTTKTPVHSARIAKAIMSGSKPRTTPVPSSQALTVPKSAAVVEHKSTPASDRKAITESKSVSAVQISSTRVSVKTPATGRDGTSCRRDGEHVTMTQSGGKGNVNIRMKISMDIKKNAESQMKDDEMDGARQSIDRAASPRARPSALLSYTPAVVREYPVEQMAVEVAVRLRPFSTKELKNPDVHRVVFLDKDKKCVTVNKNEFEFNHVLDSFGPSDPIDDQEQVYEVVGKPLLYHCLEGYNACLFAYGQTGSGKTYSMTGEEDVMHYDKQGVIPRLIKDLFLEMNLDSIVSMTYIEIYNEDIFNLLGDTTSDLQQVKYKIRESTVYGPHIPNLTPVVVENADDLLSRWSMGNIKRQKAATSCNDHSSRSHAILQITVQQKYQYESCESLENLGSDTDSQASDGDRLVSKINLVDLAGSERVAQAQTTGDRFKEGTAINKSLLTLGKVISELSSMNENRGKVHIPYRESNLTFLLKESLGGNSRTCMLATISPANTQIEETLSTLRYASKAQRIVNRVRINEDPKILRIKQLEGEVQRLIRLLENKGLTAKSLSSSASTTTTSPDTTLASAGDINSSAANSSNASTTAPSSHAPSEYATPNASVRGSKSQDKGKSEQKSSKADEKKKTEKSEAKSEKKSAKSASDKKSEVKEAAVADDPVKKSGDKKKSKKKEEDQPVDPMSSSPDGKDSDRKAVKNKQSPSKESDVSPAKKEKKNTVTEKAAKKTTESGVNTDSSPTEAKKKKVDKLVIPPKSESKLLHAINEIFAESDSSRKEDRVNETSDLTSLTYVSAGDGSSLLNQAVIESSSSAMSDSTVQEASRHVNFRDTVSMRSYQPSMDSTAAEASTASASPPAEKKSHKKSSKKKSATPEPVPEVPQSDWGATASGGWGTETTSETSGGWGGESESGGGWGSSDAKDSAQESKDDAPAESGGWGASSAPSEPASDWGAATGDSGGWGTDAAADDGTAGATDSWGADAAGASESLDYEDVAASAQASPPGDFSWGSCLASNGVTEKSEDKKDGDDDGGW